MIFISYEDGLQRTLVVLPGERVHYHHVNLAVISYICSQLCSVIRVYHAHVPLQTIGNTVVLL